MKGLSCKANALYLLKKIHKVADILLSAMPAQIPKSLLPALELFVRELDSHLSYFQDTLQELASLTPDDLKVCAHRCHTIKGGAGFLQLNSIEEMAANAEKIFKTADSEQLQPTLERVVQSFGLELGQLRKNLRPS